MRIALELDVTLIELLARIRLDAAELKSVKRLSRGFQPANLAPKARSIPHLPASGVQVHRSGDGALAQGRRTASCKPTVVGAGVNTFGVDALS